MEFETTQHKWDEGREEGVLGSPEKQTLRYVFHPSIYLSRGERERERL